MKTRALRPFVHKRGVQCTIISYPKCGRTWLRLMIGKVLSDRYHFPEAQMIDTYALTAVPGVLRTHFTHDYADIRLGYPFQYLPQDKSAYAASKVVFLMRAIRWFPVIFRPPDESIAFMALFLNLFVMIGMAFAKWSLFIIIGMRSSMCRRIFCCCIMKHCTRMRRLF